LLVINWFFASGIKALRMLPGNAGTVAKAQNNPPDKPRVQVITVKV